MDFTFSKDELLLRDAVSRFLMTEAAPEMLREIWETDSGRSPEMRSKIAAQGLTALSVPEADGGMGMGDVAWALMTQELGYFAIPDSLADTAYLAAGLLCALPQGHALRDNWLPRIADGTCRIALGHPINPLVARDAVTVTQHRSIDASRRLGAVQWTPGPATLIAAGASGQALWDASQERGALCVAGQLIGLAQRMLNVSVDYAAQRTQFGKPIGSFQAVKHHLADVVTKIEFAKPVLYRAVYALEHGEPGLAALVSHAKLVCGEAALLAARKGIQVHGAMGYTWEVDLQMFMKRAWALDSAWGDRAYHQARLCSALLESPARPAAFAQAA